MGRVIVVNQVRLSSLLYIMTSCWSFSKSCMGQLQRLIQNYLWSGNAEIHARANVSWSTIVKTIGLGRIRNCWSIKTIQSFACEIRDLSIVTRIKTMETMVIIWNGKSYPKTSGDWRPTFQWSFMEHNKVTISTKWEETLSWSALNSWKDVSLKRYQKDKLNSIDNTWFGIHNLLIIGDMLGMCTTHAWAEIDSCGHHSCLLL